MVMSSGSRIESRLSRNGLHYLLMPKCFVTLDSTCSLNGEKTTLLRFGLFSTAPLPLVTAHHSPELDIP